MNKVRMIKTQRGVHDGEIHPVSFIEGQEYEIGDALLDSFVELGAVELVEEKSHADAPANKSFKSAPEKTSPASV